MSIQWIDSNTIASSLDLLKLNAQNQDSFVCMTSKEIFDSTDQSVLLKELESTDIIHGGLLGEGIASFERVQLLAFNWNFITPKKEVVSNSWKATQDFFVFRAELITKLNGIDVQFASVNAALMDFAYRALMNGARIVYNPTFCKGRIFEPKKTISRADELRFVKKHFPRNAVFYYKFLTGNFLERSPVIQKRGNVENKTSDFRLLNSKWRTVEKYSAIIPTINRYDYLDKAIQSLLDCSVPPDEIIVVDQTPHERRIQGYYDEFVKTGIVKVVFLDEAGQAISRNTGIDQVRNEWIFLFDDDSFCWEKCIEEHIYLIEHSLSDVSTGLSLAPWKDISYIKGNIAYYRIADVLDTGNCFIGKSTLNAVGKIDTAFNRGPGADDDLGKRLYMEGYQICLNPKAIRTHYKAPNGGLREHGAWWRHKTTLLGPFPPPTQLYAIQKYYPKKYWFFLILLWLIKAKEKNTLFEYTILLLLFPLKVLISFRRTSKLKLSK